MLKNKMLYLMHVPWGWIKQRPHFLAEYLNLYFEIEVCFKRMYKNKNKVLNQSNITLTHIAYIPHCGFFNRNLIRWQLMEKVKKAEYIWCTSIELYDLISNYIQKEQIIIYDCMDDIIEFPDNKKSLRKMINLTQWEEKLIRNAHYIFFTSETLKNSIKNRYNKINFQERSYVINNAMKIPKEKVENVVPQNECKEIVYIGTISKWIDFKLILNSVERYLNISYIFFGPVEIEIPRHPRIFYKGLLEHKEIFLIMKMADALVMPFEVNDLILSVNPVKLYEYIYSCKPIIASKYPETNRFADYVYLYSNERDYMKYIEMLSNGNLPPLKGESECLKFATENSWEHRVKEILKIIKGA